MNEKFGDIKVNVIGIDDCNVLFYFLIMQEYIYIVQYFGVIDVFQLNLLGGNVGSQGNFIEVLIGQVIGFYVGIEVEVDVLYFNLMFKVVQGFVKFFFVWDVFCYVELIVNLVVVFKKMDFMFMLCGYGSEGQFCWACVYYCQFFFCLCRCVVKFCFVVGMWVDQVIGCFLFEYMIEVSLIVGDVSIDFVCLVFFCFLYEVGIGEEGVCY